MVKKLAALAGAGALLLSMAVPVFAWDGWRWGGSRDVAIVTNSASAVADTGMNSQSNVADAYNHSGATVYGGSGARTMYTGDADAYAGALVVANTHIGCGPCASGGWRHKDFAKVTNSASAGAYSGRNSQDDFAFADYHSTATTSGGAGARHMDTGDANSRARAWTIVNTHWGD